jgi:hypothetical protein
MGNKGGGMSYSFLTNDDDEVLPINLVKLTIEDIKQIFPNVTEEEVEKIQDNLITITQIIYKI